MTKNGADDACLSDLKDLTFEDALSRLDETVRSLESGNLTLAQSTAMYERGMRLARFCNETLSSAEMRISRIRAAYGDQTQMAFESGDE